MVNTPGVLTDQRESELWYVVGHRPDWSVTLTVNWVVATIGVMVPLLLPLKKMLELAGKVTDVAFVTPLKLWFDGMEK